MGVGCGGRRGRVGSLPGQVCGQAEGRWRYRACMLRLRLCLDGSIAGVAHPHALLPPANHLLQANFHTTLSGQSMVSLIYHKKLNEEWTEVGWAQPEGAAEGRLGVSW